MNNSITSIYTRIGRVSMSLGEFEDTFVKSFVGNDQRLKLWNGLKRYLDSWATLERVFDLELISGLWVGGSFVTEVALPSDIDISIFVIKSNVMKLAGKPGSTALKRLYAHRDKIKHEFGIEVFKIYDYKVSATINVEHLDTDIRLGLAQRGGADIWWQRVKPLPIEKPLETLYSPQRGYVELLL